MMKKKRGQSRESEEGRVKTESTELRRRMREREGERGGGETTRQTQPVCVSTSLLRIDSHEEYGEKTGRRGRERENIRGKRWKITE